jgi:chloramphenicol-sensitive protein RarD
VVVAQGQADLRATLRQRRVLLQLAGSAALIGANWMIYVTAVVNGHVLATSLGYYINPLINVVIGTLFLGERLRWRQWGAVAIAAVGIALLLAGAITMLGTALALAGTFAMYGLSRKMIPVSAITGMTIETLALYPFAVGWAVFTARMPAGSAIAHGGWVPLLLVISGVATAIPLILFAMAARRLTLSTLGFLQFTAPTLVFLMGVFALGERLDPLRLACFVLIWIAVALFAWDSWQHTRYLNRPAAS